MISLQEIKKFYPNLDGFDRGILREYLQYRILDLIFKHKISAKLSFLGGTAIKICYGGTRFSEDLDFDNFGLTEDEFGNLASYVQHELELLGYKAEIRNVYEGVFRCYIRMPGLLMENNLSPLPDEKILIQIDTASHGYDYQPKKYLLQKFDVFRNINLTPPDIVLSMKAAAIFGRKRMKGRDFFDVVFLLGQTGFNFDYLDKKLGISNEKALKEKLLSAATDDELKDLAKDVLPFLLNPDDQNRILSFRQYIEQVGLGVSGKI